MQPMPCGGRRLTAPARAFTANHRWLDESLTVLPDDPAMPIPGIHRGHVALDCECGATLEACDDEELLDELLEHLAAAHETPADGAPVAMLADVYDA